MALWTFIAQYVAIGLCTASLFFAILAKPVTAGRIALAVLALAGVLGLAHVRDIVLKPPVGLNTPQAWIDDIKPLVSPVIIAGVEVVVGILVFVLTGNAFAATSRDRRRQRRGLCRVCGYPRSDESEAACPECGSVLSEVAPNKTHRFESAAICAAAVVCASVDVLLVGVPVEFMALEREQGFMNPPLGAAGSVRLQQTIGVFAFAHVHLASSRPTSAERWEIAHNIEDHAAGWKGRRRAVILPGQANFDTNWVTAPHPTLVVAPFVQVIEPSDPNMFYEFFGGAPLRAKYEPDQWWISPAGDQTVAWTLAAGAGSGLILGSIILLLRRSKARIT